MAQVLFCFSCEIICIYLRICPWFVSLFPPVSCLETRPVAHTSRYIVCPHLCPRGSHSYNPNSFWAGLCALCCRHGRRTALLKDGNCLKLRSLAANPKWGFVWKSFVKECSWERPEQEWGSEARKERREHEYAKSRSLGAGDLGLACRGAVEYRSHLRLFQWGARELEYWYQPGLQLGATHRQTPQALSMQEEEYSHNSPRK